MCCAHHFNFSPDGSKFVAAFCGDIYVYDVASLTRLAVYNASPDRDAYAEWTPCGHVLVAWSRCEWQRLNPVCVWDFSRPEAPSVVTIDVGPDATFRDWSPSGTSYFAARISEEARAPNGRTTFALEERRNSNNSIIRAVEVGMPPTMQLDGFPWVARSPDSHALLMLPHLLHQSLYRYSLARVVVFG